MADRAFTDRAPTQQPLTRATAAPATDPRTAAVRDAAQFLEYAAAKLLEADAASPAGDRRARKLLGHVQTAGEVARGLALALEKAGPPGPVCGGCLHRSQGRCHVDPGATSTRDWTPVDTGQAACGYWQPADAPRKAVGT